MNSLYKTFKRYVIVFALALAFSTLHIVAVSGQQVYQVQRGERPPINLQAVPAEAIEPGVLLIKIHPQYSAMLEARPAGKESSGKVVFNIHELDQLNSVFQAREVVQSFRHQALGNQFTERHKAWELDLWYRLEFNHNADVKALAAAYSSLSDVVVAEPEYRKRLIEGMNKQMLELTVQPQPSNILNWIPNDPSFSNQWHYFNTGQSNGTPGADISLPLAWEIETGNPQVIVAIVDDGIQFTHPDLAANMWANIGYNFVNNSSNVSPGNHGTHVAGTVAAVTNNGVGVAGIAGGTGLGDGVRLMSCQVFAGNSSGGFHLAPVYAADNGAAISQNSWGYTSPGVFNQNVLDAIDYFNINGGGSAMNGGGITIFAAGNDNSSANYYPGFYSGAFAVAATSNQDSKAWYSNYGSWIDISAPGGETNSVNSRGVLSTVTNNNYAYYQGTSMACPHVSGVAALVLSLAYGELTPDDLRDILINSVDDHYASNPNFLGQLGAGRLNAYQALLETQNYITGIMNPGGFSASATGPFEVNLYWEQNAGENEILLAWSTSAITGNPVNTFAYQPGDTITGGAVVLYKGSETFFNHSGLDPATDYFYKIWSYNDTLAYSSGRTSQARTSCVLFNLPLEESFEVISVLPVCWLQEFGSGGTSWQIGSGNGGSNPPAAFDGDQNIFFRETSNSGAITRLVLPEMNLAPYDSVQLTFHYTNQRRTFIFFNFQDILRIRYKPSANAEWTTIQTFNTNVSEWTEVTITLPELSGSYFLAFEAQSATGFGVCLDEIAVNGFGTATTYTITASAGPYGSITPSGSLMVQQGAEMTYDINAITNYMIDSLVVDGVFIEEAAGQSTFSYTFNNVSQNHVISASFYRPAFDVNVSVFPAETGDVIGAGTYLLNQSVGLTAIPATGFTFDRWMEGESVASTLNPYTFNISSNRDLMAVFNISVYQIQAGSDPVGAGIVSGTGEYTHASEVVLEAIANHGYYFSHWSENGDTLSFGNPYVFEAMENRSITANYGLMIWNLTATATPAEGGTIEGVGAYLHGTTVNLTAIPSANFIFKDWWIDDEIVSTENPYTFSLNDHKNLTARFELQTSVQIPDQQGIRVYPNPATSEVYVEIQEPAEIQIADIMGRIIMSKKSEAGKVSLDLSGKNRGIYFVLIKTENTTQTRKLILE